APAAVAASAPAVPASVPAVTTAAAPAPQASAAETAPPPVAAKPASAPVAVAAKPPAKPVAPVEEPSFFSSLIDDNPLLLGLGGLAIALLGGFGIYRFAKSAKKDSGETSFLESRLQPDSFFGASGGQRIDTRDASGNSSSMSYSLSQLDAIGDVDPVAEADVYLAYGRDLQAEEILKEAMRSNPDRMAIRTKLLEVYAKRRDTKGFELLATQLYTLTRGEGEDWAKAQELGVQIDPDNPLFKPGGAPTVRHTETGELVEPLGASTMPQSVLPSPSQYGQSVSGAPLAPPPSEVGPLDLDLDLGDLSSSPSTSPTPLEATQPFAPAVKLPDDDVTQLDFSTSVRPSAKPAEPVAPEFDLSDISLDLDLPAEPSAKPFASAPAPLGRDMDIGAIDLPSLDVGDGRDDPLSRKLELAEEFRQIGDTDGARDLLNEVIAKASGTVKTRAQSMLADLG
ncbi:MAG TPA: FimV/HubP family polar landmark protein, partial [Burkholderiaceae bacterium]|nr:FimV/HubP family polar landmark protein [Burkholderiaceae bacterium]